jgi:signal transduction histidine kinase
VGDAALSAGAVARSSPVAAAGPSRAHRRPLVLAGSALTTAAWLAVVALWLRAVRRRGDDPVLIWSVLLPVTMASAEVLVLVGDVANSVVVSSAAALRAGGLFAASVGIAVGLGAHVAGRRAELLRAQAQARSAERELAQRRQERRHEVGNALFAIQGAAATLSHHAGQLDEATTRELADTVISGLGRLKSLAAEDRDASGGHADTDLSLARIVDERAALANRRGVTTAVTGDREVVARGDAVVVGQVVDNLLLNAVRHGGAGGREPVAIDLAVEAGRAVFRVRDRGPGIPPDVSERVFRRGVQLDPSTEGDGLGLYVSRRLLRELGGDLVIDTTVRDGACFVATLPLGVRADRSLDRV